MSACDYSDEARQTENAVLKRQPLEDVLDHVGPAFQEKLLNPETIALLRTVIAESARFPQLAETAHCGFVTAYEDNLNEVLAQRQETAGASAATRRKLCAAFLDDLVGKDVLRALLGLGTITVEERRKRARYAARELLSGLSRSEPIAKAR